MSFLSVGMWLLGGLRRIASAIGVLLSKLNAQGVVGLVAGLLLAFAWFHSASAARHWRKDSAQWEKKFRAEKIEFAKLVASYRDAQVKAHAKNVADVAKIETQQRDITNEVSANLNARLERIRRELRAKGTAAQSPAASASLPGGGPPASAADGEARVCIPTSKYVLGAEYEEKLDQWVTWGERQSQVKR